MKFFNVYFSEMYKHITAIDLHRLLKITDLICETNKKGGKVILAGNGGSAAIASHIAVDLTKAARKRAINFNEADLITCFANDCGYENWVAEALAAYADSADMLILISSSGRSNNMIKAALKAKQLGLRLVTFTGFDWDNPLRKLGNINLWVDSYSYNIVEMTHHIWLVAIIDKIIEREKRSKKK